MGGKEVAGTREVFAAGNEPPKSVSTVLSGAIGQLRAPLARTDLKVVYAKLHGIP